MKYLKVLVICFLSYFFDCYSSNDGNPSLADLIPQSPLLTPARGVSLGGVVSDESSSESPPNSQESKSASSNMHQGIGSVIFGDEQAAESPNLSRKEQFSNRKTQPRRGSVVTPLQPINIAAGFGINTPRPSARAFDFVPSLDRPSSSGIGVRRSAAAPASAGVAPDSAATTPQHGSLLSTPMARDITRHPSPPDVKGDRAKYTSPPDGAKKTRDRSRGSIDHSRLRVYDISENKKNTKDNQSQSKSRAQNDQSADAETTTNIGSGQTTDFDDFIGPKDYAEFQENSQDNQSKAKANASKDPNADSSDDKTNIEDNKTNKTAFYILAAVVISFSVLYKTNKKFYNKVNYYWDKIKSKIKFLYNKDSDTKPETEQSKKDKSLSVNHV